MDEKKDCFIFYREFRDVINELLQEYRLKTIEYLIDYALDGIEPEENESSVEKALFLALKSLLDFKSQINSVFSE